MPRHSSGSNAAKSDNAGNASNASNASTDSNTGDAGNASDSSNASDAGNDMVEQVAARVLAAIREQAGTQGSSRGGEGQPKADDVAQKARQKAGGVVGMMKEQATSRLDRQKQHAVEELTNVANTVRKMGEQLKQPEHGAVAQYAAQYGDMAADQLQNFSSYLRSHDVNQLLREVEGFARRQPVFFTGGAFLLGLVGARFLKSKPVTQDGMSDSSGRDSPMLALPMPGGSASNGAGDADEASPSDEAATGDAGAASDQKTEATVIS